jgi:SCY1-like protein 2
MGNKILTQYKVEKEPIVQSIDLKWKLFPATHLERSGEFLTVFLFEKKHLDAGYGKADRDAILETMRKDVQSLQRLRHPSCLQVIEALVEDRTTMVRRFRGGEDLDGEEFL